VFSTAKILSLPNIHALSRLSSLSTPNADGLALSYASDASRNAATAPNPNSTASGPSPGQAEAAAAATPHEATSDRAGIAEGGPADAEVAGPDIPEGT
jgi:hypothetical protein